VDFLQLQWTIKGNEIIVGLSNYIDETLEHVGENQTRYNFPMATGIDIVVNKDVANDDNAFRVLLGKLLYIQQRIRPDISVALSRLSRVSGHVEPIHWKALRRVENYIVNTRQLCLRFLPSDTKIADVVVCVDASFGTGSNRRSISGWCIYVNKNLVQWRTKQQTVIAQSAAEAELIAVTDAVKHGLWIKRLLAELGFEVNPKLVVECDNLPAIQLLNGSKKRDMVKHLELRYFYIKELDGKEIYLKKVDTKEQKADGLTKSLSGSSFLKFVEDLNLIHWAGTLKIFNGCDTNIMQEVSRE
jgi:hypothetical protein